MNPIKDLFNNIPDEELKEAIKEIAEDSETGIIRDGIVRKYTKLSCEMSGNGISTELFFTEINLLRQGALRWIK